MTEVKPLPEDGFLRLKEVLKRIPVGKTLWYEGIKKGHYPKPYRLSDSAKGWCEAEIRHLRDTIRENKIDIFGAKGENQ